MADHTVTDPQSADHTVPDVGNTTVTLAMPDPPPAIGGWKLGRRLGAGGMGAVHLAEKDGLQGALKLMHPSLAGTGDFRARFLREAEVLRQVSHPNVVSLLGHGEDHGWLYLVMEYVAGGDLSTHLRRRGQLFEKEAVTIAVRACRGLAALHDAGLMHRDLKPENIFLVPGGASGQPEPKIGDLGMARHTAGDDRMTLTGTACGTPAYMAPEQIKGLGDLDVRVDVYAMAATLFTLLTGRKPFDGATIYVLTHEVLTKPVPDMRRLNPQLTTGICAVVEKAMAKDRTQRHRDIRELLLDLDRLAEGKAPILSAPMPSPASMVFQEIVGTSAPKRNGGSGSTRMLNPLSGIEWGPILRLAVPAAAAIALLSGALWLFERKHAAASPQGSAGPTQTTSGSMANDSIGPLVRLPLGQQEARLRWCPPGRFLMGSPANEPGHEATEERHGVQLTHGFWMLEGEVSNAQIAAIEPDAAQARQDPRLPASDLNLADCQDWLDRLNRRYPGLGARLPSEAEWEYACRAASSGPFTATASPPRWCTHPGVLSAWSKGLFAAEDAWLVDRDHPDLRPHPAGSGGANAWGFVDLHGNLAEWCADRWDGSTPYDEKDCSDPVNPFGGLNVIRGGSWLHPAALCRSAARAAAAPGEAKAWLGFRFVVPGGASPSWPPR